MPTLNDIRIRGKTAQTNVSGIEGYIYGYIEDFNGTSQSGSNDSPLDKDNYPILLMQEPQLASPVEFDPSSYPTQVYIDFEYSMEVYLTTTHELTDDDVSPTHALFQDLMAKWLGDFNDDKDYAIVRNSVGFEFRRHWENVDAAALKCTFQLRTGNCYT